MKLSKKQSGSATVEYVVIALLFVMVVGFLPVPVDAGGDGERSATEMLVDAIKRNYNGYAWAMAMPI